MLVTDSVLIVRILMGEEQFLRKKCCCDGADGPYVDGFAVSFSLDITLDCFEDLAFTALVTGSQIQCRKENLRSSVPMCPYCSLHAKCKLRFVNCTRLAEICEDDSHTISP